MAREERSFLERINAHLPADVDWKQGARAYLEQICAKEGSHNEIFHLIKPFLGGPDFSVFFDEMYGFLNMLERLALAPRSRLLDVACGPGWTSHFLAKLGHEVVGLDISEPLIDLARRRITDEPYRVFPERPLNATFIVHDIEEAPLPGYDGFEVAFFESAMHHFYDPVSALRNVAESLAPDGVICVWESTAPTPGSESYQHIIEVMQRYHTLERPYTRDQMLTLLQLCDFRYHEFFCQVNGFFDLQCLSDLQALQSQLESIHHWNILIASRSPAFFESMERPLQTDGRGALPRMDWQGTKHSLQPPQRDNRAFVIYIFETLLGRYPDAGGLAHYSNALENGMTREQFVVEIKGSDEYRQTRRGRTDRARSEGQ